MAKRIGKTFADELMAAGVTEGLSWNEDGLLNVDLLPPARLAVVQAVLAAHDPLKPAPQTASEAKRDALLTRLDEAIADNGVPAKVRAALTALKEFHG